jgi:hypothetical protein
MKRKPPTTHVTTTYSQPHDSITRITRMRRKRIAMPCWVGETTTSTDHENDEGEN